VPDDITLWSYADRVLRQDGPAALQAWFEDLTPAEQDALVAQGEEVLAFLRNVASGRRREPVADGGQQPVL
jgi:hypothetical protein